MFEKALRDHLFWSSAILILLCSAILLGALVLVAREADRSARMREETLVQNGLDGFRAELGAVVLPNTVWDEAVENLDRKFDAAWASANIGKYFSDANDIETSFVLGRDGDLIYAFADGREGTAQDYAPFARPAVRLVAKLRSAESKRSLEEAIAKGETMSKPIQDSALIATGERIFILTATLVQPDFGKVMPQGPRAPVALSAKLVDDDFLGRFAERFLLHGLEIHHHRDSEDDEPGLAHALLLDPDGQALASFSWMPERPGTELLRRVLPPALALLAILCVVGAAIFWRSQRLTRTMVASEARAFHLAYHDALTGLPNRTLFTDRLSFAIEDLRRNDETFAVHVIDLDRFKEVNDTFGHEAGDELIRRAASVLGTACRQGDTISRLGGDEFAVIQKAATADQAAALADRLVKLMGEPVDLAIGRLYIGCSVGVTLVENANVDAAECLRQADLALYRAKDSGRAQFAFFETEMDAAVRTRRALRADLRQALDDGALRLAYQPQVNGSGELTGVEALVRWDHPTRGPVSPGIFVPIAEESGLIDTLGFFTLERAFEDSHLWPGIKVAVNISAPQLRGRDFLSRLELLVERCGIDPGRFELEITEGLLLGDDPQTHDTLRRIRELGFSLALDDFGTGYSSLSYLRRYPIDKIKIDRSFIIGLGIDAESEAVISAIVKLAEALRLDVIAEGVETMEQRTHLSSAGCYNVQGYLFGKPMSADAIGSLVLQKHRQTHSGLTPSPAAR